MLFPPTSCGNPCHWVNYGMGKRRGTGYMSKKTIHYGSIWVVWSSQYKLYLLLPINLHSLQETQCSINKNHLAKLINWRLWSRRIAWAKEFVTSLPQPNERPYTSTGKKKKLTTFIVTQLGGQGRGTGSSRPGSTTKQARDILSNTIKI